MKRAVAFLLLLLAFPIAASAEDFTGLLRNLVIGPGQSLEDVVCVACSTRVEGTVTEDLVLAWGSAEVSGSINGDVVIVGGGIHLLPGAKVTGDVVVVGGEVSKDPSATISGSVTEQWWLYFPGQRQVYLRSAAVFTAMTLGLALFGYALFRARRTQRMISALTHRPFITLLVGVAFCALAFYGLEFSERFDDYEELLVYFVLLVAFLVALPGFAAMSLWLGSRLKVQSGLAGVALGGVLWSLLMVIPLAGLLVACFLYAYCAGTALVGRFGFGKEAPATQA